MIICNGGLNCRHFKKDSESIYYCAEYGQDIEDIDYSYKCTRYQPKKRGPAHE